MADEITPPVETQEQGKQEATVEPTEQQVQEPEAPKEPEVGFKVENVEAPDGEVDMFDPVKAKEFIANTAKAEAQKIRQEQIFNQTVENEISKVIANNPEYKPYEDRIRSFVNHPSRSGFIKNGLPVQNVVFEAIAPYLLKIGAEKARAADAKAKESADVGTSRRPSSASSTPDFKNMTPAQIQEINEQVKSGRYQG